MTELGVDGPPAPGGARADRARQLRVRAGWALVLLAVLATALGLLARSSRPLGGQAGAAHYYDTAWLHSRPFDTSRLREDGRPRPQVDAPDPDDPVAWRTGPRGRISRAWPTPGP